ncbi:hypothetical protein PIB30_070379 [Stylosanthes scabra]|uniref:Uncharacterized protein n=1 Tax=Stylosanthes scabra TaxID=79078 RepID=A0ABU6VN29_9FABA|nr:hypothetical protein [Stylosanthes scabra]
MINHSVDAYDVSYSRGITARLAGTAGGRWDGPTPKKGRQGEDAMLGPGGFYEKSWRLPRFLQFLQISELKPWQGAKVFDKATPCHGS